MLISTQISFQSVMAITLSRFNRGMLCFRLNMLKPEMGLVDIWQKEQTVFAGVLCTIETPRHFICEFAKLRASVSLFVC